MRIFLISLVVFPLLLIFAGFGALYLAIRHDPGKIFTRPKIMEILTQESTVYYRDGKNRIGTFYEEFHREYTTYDSLPPLLIDAIVSAEDKNFFTHSGVDFRAFIIAVYDNIKARAIRRGGSTITMQTAENLFFQPVKGTWNRIKVKFPELLNTFKLEHFFTKQDILEFYLNQFYVTGNAKGVSIAARYFFGKPLNLLGLNEFAFIAGSVKAPDRYNPFTASTQKSKQKKIRQARKRTAYVLSRMLEDGKITRARYKAALATPLPFKKGSVRFRLSTNLVNVSKFMESSQIKELLSQHGVANYRHAGLNIWTTLDKDIQEAAEYAVYKNLSALDLIMNGYTQPEQGEMTIVQNLQPGKFYVGKICSLNWAEKRLQSIQVRFGPTRAWIYRPEIEKFFTLWNRHRRGHATLPGPGPEQDFSSQHFKTGDNILCSTPYIYQPDSGYRPVLEIETVPLIQGAAIVMKQGKILASVGGFGNTGFDRAHQAKRQFGSSFKPLVYAAALELGWHPLDTLKNSRQLFRIGNTFYFPRPAHPPAPLVSMAWAGRLSENIASVYLLYHLFDKLNYNDFWHQCRDLGIHPSEFSSQALFGEFVRDSLGLIMHSDRIREIHYDRIIEDIAVDLIFENRDREAEALKNLPYGRDFDRALEKYPIFDKKEDALQKAILKQNYLHYMQQVSRLEQWSPPYTGIYRNRYTSELAVFFQSPSLEWVNVPEFEPQHLHTLLIHGAIRIGTLKRIQSKLNAVLPGETPYSQSLLYSSGEFRVLVSLRYMVKFAQRLGISSKLDPVLSLPLGANVISLVDAANAYQSLKDGLRYYSEKTGRSSMLVSKIALTNGEVIFYDKCIGEPVIQTNTKLGVAAILRSVVTGGTGRRIHREFKINPTGKIIPTRHLITVPAFGKTGTTDDYRNGAFLGFIPGFDTNAVFSTFKGYTLGVYGGYDDNRQMKHRGFKGYGSQVALPSWLQIAKSIASIRQFKNKADFLDLSLFTDMTLPLAPAHEYLHFKVQKKNGLSCVPALHPAGICTEFPLLAN